MIVSSRVKSTVAKEQIRGQVGLQESNWANTLLLLRNLSLRQIQFVSTKSASCCLVWVMSYVSWIYRQGEASGSASFFNAC